MLLESFKPRSQLVTKSSLINKPRYQVIDIHNHLGEEYGGGWINRPIHELIDVLDQSGVVQLIDLDGGWGEDILREHLDILMAHNPERFQVFGGVNWKMWNEYGDHFAEWAALRLRAQAGFGAHGLKIWKNFGLEVRDDRGELVRVNDRRLDPIWQTAAELKFPVMIHIADPVAFFEPLDEYNERWEELNAYPEWHFPSPPYPSFKTIIDDFADLVEKHPETTFIGAHVGCYAENLQWVSCLLERCANFYVDISARIGELGRQPYTAKNFFIKHADRILYGADFNPNVDEYRLTYRFLETNDEYFNYSPYELPKQGRWYIYGLELPDDVLKKVYYENARHVLLIERN